MYYLTTVCFEYVQSIDTIIDNMQFESDVGQETFDKHQCEPLNDEMIPSLSNSKTSYFGNNRFKHENKWLRLSVVKTALEM